MTQDNTKQVRRRRRYSAQFKAELVAEYLDLRIEFPL